MSLETSILPPVRLGAPITHANLSVFPLFGKATGEPDYLTLDQALAAQSAHVTEVTDGGSVPNLRFANDGDLAVLLLDGEELIGAKQNRVLNLSILAPAHEVIVIPVSCVEQGRWNSRSSEFSASPHAQHASGRRIKTESVSESLVRSGVPSSNQNAVWEDIYQKSDRMAAASPTMAMSDIFERHDSGIRNYVAAIPPAPGQVGALFAINGRLVGLDLFDFSATCQNLLPKLIHSYALDAMDAGGASSPAPSATDAEAMLGYIECARAEMFPAVGEGRDARFFGPRISGAALLARGRTVHLSAFAREEGDTASGSPETGRGARMSRPSRRRANG